MILNILLIVGIVIAVCLGLLLIIIFINILQNGPRKRNGKTLQEILGVPVEEADFETIRGFSKARLMQLFYAASPPDCEAMQGEIDGMAPAVGVFYPFASFFLTYVYGQGSDWVGKAFQPTGEPQCLGYNLFQPRRGKPLERKRKMDTYIAESKLDKNASFQLDYAAYNKDFAGLIRDEVRKINARLYIGMGYLMIPGGFLNPTPFILHGSFRPLQGMDEK